MFVTICVIGRDHLAHRVMLKEKRLVYFSFYPVSLLDFIIQHVHSFSFTSRRTKQSKAFRDQRGAAFFSPTHSSKYLKVIEQLPQGD